MNIDGSGPNVSSSIPPYQHSPSQKGKDSPPRQLFDFDQHSSSPNSMEIYEDKQFVVIKKEPGLMGVEGEDELVRVKTEPGLETNSAPSKRLPTISEVRGGIKKINPNFDPEKEIGVENCLPCTISFYNWILSGAEEPEEVNAYAKPLHEHMFPVLKGNEEKDYTNRQQDDFYLQDTFLNDLNNPKVVRDLDESKEYTCLTDDLPITFKTVQLTKLENKIAREIENDGVPWLQHGKGTEKFKSGILFLNHRQDESRAHFLAFLYCKSASSAKYVLHIIDPQNSKMYPFKTFLSTGSKYYADNIKMWSGRNSINYDCNKTPKEIFAELKKEKTEKQNQSNELANKTPKIRLKRNNDQTLEAEITKKSKRKTNSESSTVNNSSPSNVVENPWQRLAESLKSKSSSDTVESEDNEKTFEVSLNSEAAPTRKPFQWPPSEEKELSQEDSSEVEDSSDSIEITPLKNDENIEGIKPNEMEITVNDLVVDTSNSLANLQVPELNVSFQNNTQKEKAEKNFQLGHKYFYGKSITGNELRVNTTRALEHYQIAADLMHPRAFFALGGMYTHRDIKKSFYYYKLAADHGVAEANEFVGEMYYKGIGVEQDFDKAFDYLELAVDQNSINICYKLGMMYRNGEGVKQDYRKAIKCLQSAANNGSLHACFELGKIYSEVSDVKDYEKAVKYLNLYINKTFNHFKSYYRLTNVGNEEIRAKNIEALRYLGMIYYLGGNGIEKNLGNAYKYLLAAEAQGDKKSADFLIVNFNKEDLKFYSCQKTADSGDANMQYSVGLAYLDGNGVEPNLAEAIKYLKMAVFNRHPGAASKLGMIYYTGSEGLLPNYVEAFKYLMTALHEDKNDLESAALVGRMCLEGKGTQVDLEKAGKYSIEAANKGNPVAQGTMGAIHLNGCMGFEKNIVLALGYFTMVKDQINDRVVQLTIGTLYYKGIGVKQNFNKAFKYIKRAADLGDAKAQCMLGTIYYNGKGIQPDLGKAFEYYKLAADQGDAIAELNVGNAYLSGKGVAQNPQEGVRYLKLSAAQGNLTASETLGVLFFQGAQGVAKDFAAAYNYLMISVKKVNNPQCIYYLGLLYKNGHVVEKNSEAFTFLEGASRLGYEAATFEVGNLFSEGILFSPNLTQAILYYTKVAEKGGEKAEAARERIKFCEEMLKNQPNKGSGL